jgi:hypothetical protein
MKKIAALPVVIAFLVFVSSCRKEENGVTITKVINVELKMNESFSFPVAHAGDNDDAMLITMQAMNASSCELSPLPGTEDMLFKYVPAINFTGTDVVQVSNEEGSHGGCGNGFAGPGGHGNNGKKHHHDNSTVYIFKINITGSSTKEK